MGTMTVGELRQAIYLLPATMPVRVQIGDVSTPLETESLDRLLPRHAILTLVGLWPAQEPAAKPEGRVQEP
jgi:hypothetical protein